MNKLLALADRVEKLTGPDREVDAEIWWHVGPGRSECVGYTGQSAIVAAGYYFGRNPQIREADLTMADVGYSGPQYTTSLDAAMTLVPEGCFPHFGKAKGMPVQRTWYADCAPPNRNDWLEDEWFCETEAATPALALASSALRARAHGGGEG